MKKFNFQKFFDANYDGVEYAAEEARGGLSLGSRGQEGRGGQPGQQRPPRGPPYKASRIQRVSASMDSNNLDRE